jgi:hypothetical protein
LRHLAQELHAARVRRLDRLEDRAIFDVLGPAGILVMGLGLAVYFLF